MPLNIIKEDTFVRAKKLNQTGGMLKNLKQVVVLQITAKKPGVSDKYT